MDKIDRPTKQQVRDWLVRRHLNPEPPPGMEQIRRELGWKLLEKTLRPISRVASLESTP